MFKKISAAYKILSDPEKKRRYENGTGFDDIFSDGVNRGRRSYHHGHHYQHFYHDEFDPFDLFQQMFGGNMFHHPHMRHQRQRQRFHQRTQRQNHQQRAQQQQQGNNSAAIILVVVWMLLIFFMGMGGAQNEPLFSIYKTRKYPIKK